MRKAFTILEAMDRMAAPLPLRSISDSTGINKATSYRILQTLSELGYVTQQPTTGHYQLTMKLSQLGHIPRHDKLIARALPLMEDLHRTFNETTNLGVLEGNRVYYLRSLETTEPLRWIVRPGDSDSFHCTALGRAITAHLPTNELETLLRGEPFEARTPSTPTTAKALRNILDNVRQEGWALDDEDNDHGVTCLAVPLLDVHTPVAAISVSIPKSRLNDQRIKQLVPALLAVRERWQTTVTSEATLAHPRP